MATIQFSNGQSVEFNGNPTQQDVEEAANKLGINGNQLNKQTPTSQPISQSQSNPNQSLGFSAPDFQGPAQDITSGINSAAQSAIANEAKGTLGGELRAAGNLAEGGLRAVGGVANAAGNIFTAMIPNAIKNWFTKTNPNAANDPNAGIIPQKIGQALTTWSQQHPEAAKDFTAAINTAGLVAGEKLLPSAETTTNAIGEGATSAYNKIGTGLDQRALSKEDNFISKLITPNMSEKATTSAIKTGKVAEGKGITGARNFAEATPNFNNIKESVKQVPGVSAKNTFLKNSNAIHQEIGNVAENLKTQLQGKGSFTPAEFNKYMSGVRQNLVDNPVLVGDAKKTADKLLTKFNSLIAEKGYTPSGLLEARKSLDSWVAKVTRGNVFNPASENALTSALRAIRQGGNDFLAKHVTDVPVKDLLQHQSNLYQAIENIAPKAAKEAETKSKRFFLTPVGKIIKVGAKAGAIGAVGAGTYKTAEAALK